MSSGIEIYTLIHVAISLVAIGSGFFVAKCRKYVDPDLPDDELAAEATQVGAEVKFTGEYDGNPARVR
jgi:hypothetical protein